MAEVETLGKASKPNMANPTDEVTRSALSFRLLGCCCPRTWALIVPLFLPTEQHYPRASVPVWGLFCPAVAPGGLVHSRTQPHTEIGQPQEAQ